MKRAILILCIGGSLIFGCDANRKKTKSYSRSKHRNTMVYKPANKPSEKSNIVVSASNEKTTKASSDSLIKNQQIRLQSNPRYGYYGVSGPGTGGSYASSSYRQTEMNRQKYEKRALAELKERKRIMDSLQVEVDSTDYYWNQ